MKLLVAGGDRVDAGKTTFSVGLLAHLAAAGFEPVGFKPRAGNDYWFDHDDVRAAVAEGRLYGKDAARLAAASTGDPTPESLNPVHRLWRPTPGTAGLLGETGRTFLVDRLTTAEGETFVVNGEAVDAGDLPVTVAEALPLADAVRVDSVAAFNDRMAADYVPAFERLAERIRATETAVVESYSDIALPVSGVDFDAIAVVEPTRCRVYDGTRFLKSREVASGSPREGQLEERVESVVGMLDPLATVELPALSGEERSDPAAVAAANEAACEALVDAV
jgi:predicted P-loop ATPase/GTPase